VIYFFFQFWDPTISRELLKVETSNLARRLSTRGSNDKKMQKSVKGGQKEVTWPTFEILWPLPYIWNG